MSYAIRLAGLALCCLLVAPPREKPPALATATIDLGAELPFVAVSPDGGFAAAWKGDDNFAVKQKNEIVVVNLEDGTIVSRRRIDHGIHALALDADYVYMARPDSDVVEALDHATLEPRHRLFRRGQTTGLQVMPGDRIAVAGGGNEVSFFSTPQLKPLPTPVFDPQGAQQLVPFERFLPYRIAQGWVVQGNLLDPKLERVLHLVNPAGMPLLGKPNYEGAGPAGMVSPSDLSWDRRPDMQALITKLGQRITFEKVDTLGGMSQEESVTFRDIPAAASVRVWTDTRRMERGQGKARLIGEILIRHLLDGRTVETMPLFEHESDQNRHTPHIPNVGARGRPLETLGNRVVAVLGGKLYIRTVRDAALKALEAPIQFLPIQGSLRIDPAAPPTLAHTVRGGEPPYTFTIRSEFPSITVEARTGTVRIDGPALVDEVLERIPTSDVLRIPRINPATGLAELVSAIDPALKVSVPAFRAITGQPARGFPLGIGFTLLASDNNSQMATYYQVLLLDLPIDRLRDRLGKLDEDARRRLAEQRRAAEPQTTSPATEARIRELEARVAALEAKLELLTKLLSDRKHDKP